jgi:hypothetical protein
MRKMFLVTAMLLLCGAWMVAQTSSYPHGGTSSSGNSAGQMGSSGASGTPGHMGAKMSKIEGCLSGSAGNFTLTDKAGTTYRLEGDSAQLSKHVGQEVRIEGSTAGSSSAAGTSSSATSSSSGTESSINVSRVHKVSSTCTSNTSGTGTMGTKPSK